MPACMSLSSTEGMRLLPFFFALPEIHSFIYLAFIIVTTVTLEQVTSLNKSLLKSFYPNA
jgi:hypothetical protein